MTVAGLRTCRRQTDASRRDKPGDGTRRLCGRVVFAANLLGFVAAGAVPWQAYAAETSHFNPDTHPDRIQWYEVTRKLGPTPDVRGNRYGIVLKTQTNEYWRLMAAGYRKRAAIDHVKLDIQAAQSETDPTRQLAIMETMIGGFYQGLLISPQSDSNLAPAIIDAKIANLPLVDVDGAVVDDVNHFVGAVNREMGERVARWFIKTYPNGGKIAVVKGLPGVFSTVQRSAGFLATLAETKKFQVVAIASGDWSRKKAYDATLAILAATPDLTGIYCNNDTMALGVVEAVKASKMLDTVRVFGTDGTRDAYASIERGELTGTVDIFPMLIAAMGLEIVERLSAGQSVPRVIATPQALVTRDNLARYRTDDVALQKALLEDATVKPVVH